MQSESSPTGFIVHSQGATHKSNVSQKAEVATQVLSQLRRMDFVHSLGATHKSDVSQKAEVAPRQHRKGTLPLNILFFVVYIYIFCFIARCDETRFSYLFFA